jgi:hypothetical protein
MLREPTRRRCCVIDGEVAMLDEGGSAVFELIQPASKVMPEALLFAFRPAGD